MMLKEFNQEITNLRNKIRSEISEKDYSHLKRVIWINRAFLFSGFACSWYSVNIISMVFISIALTGMWTIVAHHTIHGAYNTIEQAPKKYQASFAKGFRRWIDWPDWFLPEYWRYEHNVLHHMYLNQFIDPDQASYYIDSKFFSLIHKLPNPISYIVIILVASFWKPIYYVYNTTSEWNKKYNPQANTLRLIWQMIYYSYIPYIFIHFILVPLPFALISHDAFICVLLNRIGAEILTNLHTFFIIVPNHTGEDIFLLKDVNNKDEFYLSQILGSCNYKTGGFVRDYLHGYLNYQIEHHLFPNFPPSKYPEIQKEVIKICQKYNIPYLQESVLVRISKYINIITQKKSMPTISIADFLNSYTRNSL